LRQSRNNPKKNVGKKTSLKSGQQMQKNPNLSQNIKAGKW